MTLGERFREAREQQGLSLEQVEEETKIRKLYLQAIENQEFSTLPPRVYAIGFVKRYARLLGLAEDEVAEEFKILAYGNDIEEEVIPTDIKTDRKFSVKNIVAGVIFLVIAVWAGNYVVDYISDNGIKNVPAPPPVVEEPADKNQVNDLANDNETPIPQETGVDMKVHARENCWLYVKVDGQDIFSGILPAGENKTFSGQEEIYIKAGNAGGIDVTFNGQDIGSLGQPAEVKEKTFTKNNKF